MRKVQKNKEQLLREVGRLRRELARSRKLLDSASVELASARTNEAVYKALCRNSSWFVCVFEVVAGSEGVIVDWILRDANREALHNIGKPLEEIAGLRVSEIFGVEKMAPLIGISQTVIKRGSPFTHEIYCPGSGKCFLCTCFPTGENYYVTAGVDITDRKRIKELLIQSERRLRLALEAGRMGTWDWEVGTDNAKWSEGHYTLLGYRAGEVQPSNEAFRRRVHPEDRARWEQALNEALQNGTDYICEHRVIWPDGSVHWLEARGRCTSDSSGKANRMYGVIADIDEKKRVETALRESETRFRAFMDNSPTSAWMKDEKGRYVYLSASGEKSFGARFADCFGRTDFEIFPLKKARRYRKSDVEVLKKGAFVDFIEEATNPDGTLSAWWKFKFPFRDAEGKNYVGGIGLDISERRSMEDELRKARDELEVRVRERTAELADAIESLREHPSRLIMVQEEERKRIGGELHDSIGQTLAALKYWVELTLLARSSGNQDEAFSRLEQFIPTLQRSIEETRAIYMGLRPTTLDSMGAIATIRWFCREFLNLYPNQHIEIESGVAEKEIPDALKVVIFRITQEALNNIARHSRAEWVDISLVRKEGCIRLTISDDGVGFDVDSVLSRAYARSLGLTGMKDRAEIMGGNFSITSSPGQGTTVRVAWPVQSKIHRRLSAVSCETGLLKPKTMPH